MADSTQDAMAAAGFVQPGADGTVQTPPTPPVTPAPVTPNTNNNFSSMLQDNSGGMSSMRVLMLLWGVGVFVVWAAGCGFSMYHGVYVFPTLPPEIVTILLGVTGVKCVQRFGEK